MIGIVLRTSDKGFGFLQVDGQEDDIFFHSRDLIDIKLESMTRGDRVNFSRIEDNGTKGKCARNVKLA